jgi:small nuclear ribonucleoprotein (snRNP)-like protein
MGSRREPGVASGLVSVVQALEGYKVIVELRNDVVLRGMLDAVDQYLKWVETSTPATPSPRHRVHFSTVPTFSTEAVGVAQHDYVQRRVPHTAGKAPARRLARMCSAASYDALQQHLMLLRHSSIRVLCHGALLRASCVF